VALDAEGLLLATGLATVGAAVAPGAAVVASGAALVRGAALVPAALVFGGPEIAFLPSASVPGAEHPVNNAISPSLYAEVLVTSRSC